MMGGVHLGWGRELGIQGECRRDKNSGDAIEKIFKKYFYS